MVSLSNRKRAIINQLQTDILRWQGFVLPQTPTEQIGLGQIEKAFPNGIFPTGCIHEFVGTTIEQASASSGFISGILSLLMRQQGTCLWIGLPRMLYPPALKNFGITPDRVIFITVRREREILWAMEEALKCTGLAAVVAELSELDFIRSRRLQLAAEKSKVTGFILRGKPVQVGSTACAARWQINHLPSQLEPGMPGVGFPRWNVELLKVRNGNPSSWQVEWFSGQFHPVSQYTTSTLWAMRNQKIG
ncbi:ImuA family protein [Parapedobacter soli]|uniref:ImuA family protein n=1 Tax=Parapedobacter soli TaxID=416955 RepID=UPI0021C5FB11|nr:Error-prone repair protein ImuA [Parapedobacter soli]